MKLSITPIVAKRYLSSSGRGALVVQCLGFGLTGPTIGGILTKAIDNADLERFLSNDLFCGLIGGHASQSDPNRYRRSGERKYLNALPT